MVSHVRHQTQRCPIASNASWKQYPPGSHGSGTREKCYQVLEQEEPWWPSGDQLIMGVVGNNIVLFWLPLHQGLVLCFWLSSLVLPLSLKLWEEFAEEKALKGRIVSSWGNQMFTSMGLSQASLHHKWPPVWREVGTFWTGLLLNHYQKIQGHLCWKLWVSLLGVGPCVTVLVTNNEAGPVCDYQSMNRLCPSQLKSPSRKTVGISPQNILIQ